MRRSSATVDAERRAENVLLCAQVLGCEDVFKHRHGFPQADVLERAGNAELCDLVGRRVENFILEIHLGVHALIFLLHFAPSDARRP